MFRPRPFLCGGSRWWLRGRGGDAWRGLAHVVAQRGVAQRHVWCLKRHGGSLWHGICMAWASPRGGSQGPAMCKCPPPIHLLPSVQRRFILPCVPLRLARASGRQDRTATHIHAPTEWTRRRHSRFGRPPVFSGDDGPGGISGWSLLEQQRLVTHWRNTLNWRSNVSCFSSEEKALLLQ